jgi:DNA-binding CsgD family transcriptional regulator
VTEPIAPDADAIPGELAVIRCGGDLVLLAERTYQRLLVVALAAVAAASVVSALLVVVAPSGARLALTLALAATIFALAALALVRAGWIYTWLRRTRARHALPAGIGAALLLADGPQGPLWFVAMALLTVTAVVGETATTLLLAASCSLAYGIGTMIPERSLLPGGDALHLAAALGFMVNGLLARGMVDWLARFILGLRDVEGALLREERAPIRIVAEPWDRSPAAVVRQSRPSLPLRLTARQLEVVLLLRDGLDQQAMAEALGISKRQVERHVAQARHRTDSATTAQLVARLVAASAGA